MINLIRTYMVYAGLTFLGYEYATTKEEVIEKTCKKFGPPDIWNEKDFTAKIIPWPEEETA